MRISLSPLSRFDSWDSRGSLRDPTAKLILDGALFTRAENEFQRVRQRPLKIQSTHFFSSTLHCS